MTLAFANYKRSEVGGELAIIILSIINIYIIYLNFKIRVISLDLVNLYVVEKYGFSAILVGLKWALC